MLKIKNRQMNIQTNETKWWLLMFLILRWFSSCAPKRTGDPYWELRNSCQLWKKGWFSTHDSEETLDLKIKKKKFRKDCSARQCKGPGTMAFPVQWKETDWLSKETDKVWREAVLQRREMMPRKQRPQLHWYRRSRGISDEENLKLEPRDSSPTISEARLLLTPEP